MSLSSLRFLLGHLLVALALAFAPLALRAQTTLETIEGPVYNLDAPAIATSCCSSDDRGCSGDAYCGACKNCSGCKHCNEGGGTCGVCSSGASYSAPAPRRAKPKTHAAGKPKSAATKPKSPAAPAATTSRARTLSNVSPSRSLATTTAAANVRSSPATTGPVLVELAADQTVLLGDCTGNWCRVSVYLADGSLQSGYIAEYLLKK